MYRKYFSANGTDCQTGTVGFEVQGSGFRVSPGGVPPFDWGMKASHKLGIRNEELGMKVAASPQSINRAMPEGGIQVTSHQALVTPNPQSLIPSYSSLLSNFGVSFLGVPPFNCVRKRGERVQQIQRVGRGWCGAKNNEAPRSFDDASRRRYRKRPLRKL